MPTQQGPRGISFDFNLGARVLVPEGTWKVRLSDLDTGDILFETDTKGAFVNSAKRFYVRFGVEIWEGAERILHHEFTARDREVLIQFPVGTLGDTIGWLPYTIRFKAVHCCRPTIALAEKFIGLFADVYPDVTFLSHEQVKTDRFYATYSIGLFFDDISNVWLPTDFRHVGLHRTAGYILGIDPAEEAPRIAAPEGETRPLEAPCVCIAVQASTACKIRNKPYGWH